MLTIPRNMVWVGLYDILLWRIGEKSKKNFAGSLMSPGVIGFCLCEIQCFVSPPGNEVSIENLAIKKTVGWNKLKW